ncbi:DUF3617 domain-containing protein [Sphingomonas hankyongi]|uniref:DUF3617 domain-containing protein n=1 Tax=Sphingomonas hankyongi TaxID=2908209 RepID=A0ABT0RYS2_9SPHN|nr:DUF3617 domain-containing protein [Sphingomonas hankyongi]MCL6728759.1 DUF3617 domain-containing protein [Sphingomonas hankyongi]
MKYTVALIACALPLAACGKSPAVHEENASVAEVQNSIAEAGGTDSFVRPGLWESKVTLEEMSMPGMPKEVAAKMAGATGKAEVNRSCLTPDEAKRPKEGFFAGDNKNCRYDHFTMAGGKIDAVMKCSAEGATHTMTLQGGYTPNTYDMRMTMNAEGGAGPNAGMTMKMHVEASRVGECTGKES